MQIYAASRITQTIDAIRTNRTERRDFFTSVRDSPYIPEIIAKLEATSEISAEDEIRLLNHNAAFWGLVYSEWIQARLDVSSEYRTSQSVNLYYLFSQPRALDWFDTYGKILYPKEFVSHVEGIRKEYDPEVFKSSNEPST